MGVCVPNKQIRVTLSLSSNKHKLRIIELAKMKKCTVTELVRGYIFDGLSKEPVLTEFKPKQ